MRVRIILAFVVLAAASLATQTFHGTILGTVTDTSGAVVSGAKIAVKNENTGLERSTQTSADGSYSKVVVDVATERRVDAKLKTGKVTEVVEVSGEDTLQVNTTSAELGGTITTETIESLPVNGRDYTKLIYLNPGVSGSPDQISDSPGLFGTFSMNGSRGRQQLPAGWHRQERWLPQRICTQSRKTLCSSCFSAFTDLQKTGGIV